MEFKIKSKNRNLNQNTKYQWDNRCAIWGEVVANTKDRKQLSKIKKHIKSLEKKLKQKKITESKENRMLSYIKGQGYSIEVVK